MVSPFPEPEHQPDTPANPEVGAEVPAPVEEVVEKPKPKPKPKRKRKKAAVKRPKKVAPPREPITADTLIEGANAVKERALGVVSGEANDFIGKWASRITGGVNSLFDALDPPKKKKDEDE